MNAWLHAGRAARLSQMLGGVALFLALGASAVGADAGASQRVRVAAVSFTPVKFGLGENAATLERLVREAAAGGAKLVVAPEGALDGYNINEVLAAKVAVTRLAEVALRIDDPRIAHFGSVARELGLCVVFGFSENAGGEFYNTAVFIDDRGKIRGRYRKMQFDEGYHPSWWFNRLGQESRAFDTPFGRCGILICNDRWNPALARIPALDGAQFLVIPAYGSTGGAQDAAVVARSRETGLPIVEANVGVSLVVSEGKPVAVARRSEAVTFADVVIPPAAAPQPAARDAEERAFLAWREVEMRRRFEAKAHRFTGVERSSTTGSP